MKDLDLLTPKEAAKFTGYTLSTLATRRCRQGDDPPYLKEGKRIYYRRVDLEAYMGLRHPTPPEGDHYLSGPQAARFLKVSEVAVSHWRKVKSGPPYRELRGDYFYLLSDLKAFAEKRKDRAKAKDRAIYLKHGNIGEDYLAVAKDLKHQIEASLGAKGMSVKELVSESYSDKSTNLNRSLAQLLVSGNPTLRTLVKWARALGCELTIRPPEGG